MELCRILNIMPYCAVVITGLGLHNYGSTAVEVQSKVHPLIKDAVNDGATKYHIIHSPTGDVTDKLLLEFSNKGSQDVFEAEVVRGSMTLGTKNCKVKSAYQ